MANQSPPASKGSLSHGGFTLTELLIAIAIVAVLMGLLFPAVRSVMQISAGGKCIANLKQFGLAVHAYAADTGQLIPSKEWIPSNNGGASTGGMIWRSLLEPYLPFDKRVGSPLESCPAESTPFGGPPPFGGYSKYAHFGWNASTSAAERPFKRVVAIKNPTKLFLMADSSRLDWKLYPPVAKTEGKTGGFVFRHGNKANCLFFDGHVEALAFEDIPSDSIKWTPPYNAFWTGD